MSLTYITECDICHERQEGWESSDNWIQITLPDMARTRLDYCVKCWEKIQKLQALEGEASR